MEGDQDVHEQKIEESMELIKKEHAAVHEYMVERDPALWARAKFSLPRFNMVTSNSAEALSSWLGEQRDKSHLLILHEFAIGVSSHHFEHFLKLSDIAYPCPPALMVRYKAELTQGCKGALQPCAEIVFGMKAPTGPQYFIVNLNQKMCGCGQFQETLFLCLHAAAAID
ncbi:hypothetical protein PsorP6_019572 [Peronosclerospora sorghi]|nr:hypothetical protein PsorP6_019572 [Peronosclerospora sorghi]